MISKTPISNVLTKRSGVRKRGEVPSLGNENQTQLKTLEISRVFQFLSIESTQQPCHTQPHRLLTGSKSCAACGRVDLVLCCAILEYCNSGGSLKAGLIRIANCFGVLIVLPCWIYVILEQYLYIEIMSGRHPLPKFVTLPKHHYQWLCLFFLLTVSKLSPQKQLYAKILFAIDKQDKVG